MKAKNPGIRKPYQKGTFPAIATLTGTVMGAGFLGIPYVTARSGFLAGVLYIVILGLIMLLMNLYLGEIALRTKKDHQLTGYAGKYLGKIGRRIMFVAALFGIYGALIAYLIGEGNSLSFLITGGVDYSIYFALGFWLILSFFVYHGIRGLKKGESFGLVFVLILLFLIIILFSPKIDFENLKTFDSNFVFLPFGVILFAFLGYTALPEMEIILKGKEKLMKKAIIIGSLVPILFYIIFTGVVVGVMGIETPEIATIALGRIFVLLGIITLFTAFFGVSIAIKETFMFDYNFGRKKAWFLASVLPLLFYLFIKIFNLVSFITILGVVGAVAGGLKGILILLMVKNAKIKGNRKPEYSIPVNWIIILILSLIFIFGIYAELFL